jgi:NADPH:quinone reductase-like Zn-dependent oxidoreductase
MRAFLARAYGGPEVMQLGELPDPVAGKGQVLVTVHAASINPVDWKVRNGDMRFITGHRFPRAYGSDLAGVVRAAGPGAATFSVGERVYGVTAVMLRRPGAHAEQVAIGSKHLRRLPDGINFEQAAALPVAGLTALSGLRKCGDLTSKSVLVNGATGGVGHFAVQIAKARGARVAAVCSARNGERAKALGADPVLDYRTWDPMRDASRYDVVFDAFGHLPFSAAARLLAPGGCYATTQGSPSLFFRAAWQRIIGGQRIVFANLRDKPEDYAALEALVLGGRVAPITEHVFPLQRAADAFAAAEAGGVVGKAILRVV